MSDVRKQATERFNSMPDEDRHKAGLSYSLAQLDTIAHIRQTNKEMIRREDLKLAAWAKSLESWIKKEYLPAAPSPNTEQEEKK